jgi:hypothetical protein
MSKNKPESFCPCVFLKEPCHPTCSCVNPFSSSGCHYCSTYGSEEKQKGMAKSIDGRMKDSQILQEFQFKLNEFKTVEELKEFLNTLKIKYGRKIN